MKRCARFGILIAAFGMAAVMQAGCSLFPPPEGGESTIFNGSFEIDGEPTLSEWQFTCNDPDDPTSSHASHQDGAPGHGAWSLQLLSGNTQGCFPRLAYQNIPEAQDGEIWRLSAWARQSSPENTLTNASIYWESPPFSPYDARRPATLDTTSATGWERLTVIDTLEVEEGESLAVVLDPGLTGSLFSNQSYFDGVTAEKIGEVQ